MKDLKAIRGTYYIHRLIDEGEHENQDFKFAVNDARKIARSLSAFANHSGGRLLVGVKDNGVIAGIRNEEDIYVIEQAAEMYCRPAQTLRFTTFICDNGLVVLRAEIDAAADRPVLASEPDGTWRAYYRVADENIAVPKLMSDAWERRSRGGGSLLSVGETEQQLLGHLRRNPDGLTFEQFATGALISRERARETLLDLYAMDLVSFAYRRGTFLITV
ncbi:MAG: ATP-binding protein [Clostridium sp.]|nr:ATP-binding protein [Clostridium sp.]